VPSRSYLHITLALLLTENCQAAPPEDYARARAHFATKLRRCGPSPVSAEFPKTPKDDRVIVYQSGPLRLRAFVDNVAPDGRRWPAVLFLHNGRYFGPGDWEMPGPFRDAGFVVAAPVLRGENGQPGYFSMLYDEVGDVLAAADALTRLPYVDPDRVYLAGHGEGATLAMLTAMTSPRFRAAAFLSGTPDQGAVDYQGSPVFDTVDPREVRLRCPLAYATSVKCPARLYYGSREGESAETNRRTASLAKATGLDVAAEGVPGDRDSSVPEAMLRSVQFFRRHANP
jgi:dienelactone hydrolase